MEDVLLLVVRGVLWGCVGCLLGMWIQGKLSALWTAIRNDRDDIGQLKVIVSTDRDRIEALTARVEELESKFVTTSMRIEGVEINEGEWINMADIYNSVDTDFQYAKVDNLNENN